MVAAIAAMCVCTVVVMLATIKRRSVGTRHEQDRSAQISQAASPHTPPPFARGPCGRVDDGLAGRGQAAHHRPSRRRDRRLGRLLRCWRWPGALLACWWLAAGGCSCCRPRHMTSPPAARACCTASSMLHAFAPASACLWCCQPLCALSCPGTQQNRLLTRLLAHSALSLSL